MGKITLGQYMWERIHQIGVDTIFGVPGDFNLQFLDAIFKVDGLKWVGNQNELNSAYAADGYAKLRGLPGVFVTTHGVGELSALNGVAGAMSEHVKMIHIVGQTTRAMQQNKLMIHHSIGRQPDHQQYNHASRGLRFAAAELWDVDTAPAEIDRVIRECFIHAGPVYIFLPLDLSSEEVDAELLKTPIDVSPKVDGDAEAKAVESIIKVLSEAKNPAVIVDVLVQRFGAVAETRELVSKLRIPIFSAPMGKGIVDETHEMYVGTWVGAVSPFGVGELGRAADAVITLGYLPADTNSGAFSRGLTDDKTIHVNPVDTIIKGQTIPNTNIKSLIKALASALPSKPIHTLSKPQPTPGPKPSDIDLPKLTQTQLWPAIQSFLQPHDIVIGETGTTNFGIWDLQFPADVPYISQVYYGSIGWATPAALGVEIAKREMGKTQGRTILLTGDGSMALTIQEVGTLIKAMAKTVIIVLNNSGYTVERMIWGAQQEYNDIVPTQYSHLLPLYSHPSPSDSYHLARTQSELQTILTSPALRDPQHVQLVEVVLDKMDTSWLLGGLLASRGESSRQYLKDEGFVNAYGDWGLKACVEGTVKWS